MNNRGGKRKGAGRKPSFRDIHLVSARLSEEEWKKAKRLGLGNLSAGIRLALNQFKETAL